MWGGLGFLSVDVKMVRFYLSVKVSREMRSNSKKNTAGGNQRVKKFTKMIPKTCGCTQHRKGRV